MGSATQSIQSAVSVRSAKGTTQNFLGEKWPNSVTSHLAEKPNALVSVTFGPLGPQNRYFLPKNPKKEKWPA
jgi:hypothetical protein